MDDELFIKKARHKLDNAGDAKPRRKGMLEKKLQAGQTPMDRLKGESNGSYKLFKEWLEFYQDRTMVEFCEDVNRSYSTITKIAMNQCWKDRAVWFESQMAKHDFETIKKEREKTIRQHMYSVRKMRKLGMLAIEKLLNEAEMKVGQGHNINARDALLLISNSIKLERLMIGEVTDRVGKEAMNLSNLSDAELEQFTAILEKVNDNIDNNGSK